MALSTGILTAIASSGASVQNGAKVASKTGNYMKAVGLCGGAGEGVRA